MARLAAAGCPRLRLFGTRAHRVGFAPSDLSVKSVVRSTRPKFAWAAMQEIGHWPELWRPQPGDDVAGVGQFRYFSGSANTPHHDG
jgi:hypothetical protein